MRKNKIYKIKISNSSNKVLIQEYLHNKAEFKQRKKF